jgi:iron(III) transport system permease protein
MQKADNLDVTAKRVLFVGAGAAIYLIAVPVAMLLFAALRGPADFLPFEPGARWSLEHVRALFTDPVIYTRILPDTFVFVLGTVALVFVIAFGLAWLVERTDLPGREIWFSLILFPLLVPIPVLAIAWIFLMGPNAGWLNLAIRAAFGLKGSGPIDVFSMGGLILCAARRCGSAWMRGEWRCSAGHDGDQQRHDRGGVPKSHRLSRRSLMRAPTADAPRFGRGG